MDMNLNLQKQEDDQEATTKAHEFAAQSIDVVGPVISASLLQQHLQNGDLVRLDKLTAKDRRLHQRFWEEYSYVQ